MAIEFKGKASGIIIQTDHSDIDSIINELQQRKNKINNFFKGAKIIGMKGIKLNLGDRKKLASFLNDNFGMFILSLEEIKEEKKEPKKTVEVKTQEVAEVDHKEKVEVKMFKGIKTGSTRFIHRTLRSGTKLEEEGNVVIIGDINPGAEVFANGNIIVMGRLNGLVHAGFNGNSDAFITAYKLNPRQLRISKFIAVPPEDSESPEYPELARVSEGKIIIEPYN